MSVDYSKMSSAATKSSSKAAPAPAKGKSPAPAPTTTASKPLANSKAKAPCCCGGKNISTASAQKKIDAANAPTTKNAPVEQKTTEPASRTTAPAQAVAAPVTTAPTPAPVQVSSAPVQTASEPSQFELEWTAKCNAIPVTDRSRLESEGRSEFQSVLPTLADDSNIGPFVQKYNGIYSSNTSSNDEKFRAAFILVEFLKTSRG